MMLCAVILFGYWPTMRKVINVYVDTCHSCEENTASLRSQVPILIPIPREPWDTIAIHFLNLPLTSEGLVATDHFSRFSALVALKNKADKTVAKVLVEEVFCKFNMPPMHFRAWVTLFFANISLTISWISMASWHGLFHTPT